MKFVSVCASRGSLSEGNSKTELTVSNSIPCGPDSICNGSITWKFLNCVSEGTQFWIESCDHWVSWRGKPNDHPWPASGICRILLFEYDSGTIGISCRLLTPDVCCVVFLVRIVDKWCFGVCINLDESSDCHNKGNEDDGNDDFNDVTTEASLPQNPVFLTQGFELSHSINFLFENFLINA